MAASSKLTSCFLRFRAAFVGSHSTSTSGHYGVVTASSTRSRARTWLRERRVPVVPFTRSSSRSVAKPEDCARRAMAGGWRTEPPIWWITCFAFGADYRQWTLSFPALVAHPTAPRQGAGLGGSPRVRAHRVRLSSSPRTGAWCCVRRDGRRDGHPVGGGSFANATCISIRSSPRCVARAARRLGQLSPATAAHRRGRRGARRSHRPPRRAPARASRRGAPPSMTSSTRSTRPRPCSCR